MRTLKSIDFIKRLELELIRMESAVSQKKRQIKDASRALAEVGTGDPVFDYVMFVYGHNLDIVEKYRTLEEFLKDKMSELVLVSFFKKEISKHVFGGDSEYKTVHYCRIGILETAGLIFEEKEGCRVKVPTLPVSRYIKHEVEYFCEKKDVLLMAQKGGLLEGSIEPPSLPALMVDDRWKHSLIIGDESVKKWLTEHHMSSLFKPAADALSKLILEPTDDCVVEEGFE